jgi:hypothetical protein
MILALAAGAPAIRARKVHRRFAADIQIGRQFQATVVANGLIQADAYALEARLIAKHRRETEGGTLWNVLAGGEGFQGILHDDWILVASQAVATKALTGSGKRAGAKAAATKALTGSGLRAGAKATATKFKKRQQLTSGDGRSLLS